MNAVEAAGTRAAERVGFDPATIIAILMFIIKIWQQCHPAATKAQALKALTEENGLLYREGGRKCPLAFRRAFRQNGIADREDQNEAYAAIVHACMEEKTAISALLAA